MTKRLVVLLITGALTFTAAPAMAHEATFDSKVSLSKSAASFSGKLTGERPRCARNREVTLFKVRQNRPDRAIGTDTANSNGGWRINEARDSGRYYVRMAAFTYGSYGHTHRCAGDTSRTVTS